MPRVGQPRDIVSCDVCGVCDLMDVSPIAMKGTCFSFGSRSQPPFDFPLCCLILRPMLLVWGSVNRRFK